MRVLVYGYGNPGRQDDVLGIRLAEYMLDWSVENSSIKIETDTAYQLNIEDSERISSYDLVIFCDASIKDIKDFVIEEVAPEMNGNFSMHQVSPSFILGLCKAIFNKEPLTYQVHIKGYSWEFMEEITSQAEKNLAEAKKRLVSFLEENCQVPDNKKIHSLH